MIDHTAILAALAELRTTAEAAAGADVRLSMDWPRTAAKDALIRHFAAWDPAHSLRWLSWAEQVAARHAPKACECGNPAHFVCTQRPSEESPCEEYAGLIVALGLEET